MSNPKNIFYFRGEPQKNPDSWGNPKITPDFWGNPKTPQITPIFWDFFGVNPIFWVEMYSFHSISNEFTTTFSPEDLTAGSVLKVKFDTNCGSAFYFGKITLKCQERETTQMKVLYEDGETLQYTFTQLLEEEYFCNDPFNPDS